MPTIPARFPLAERIDAHDNHRKLLQIKPCRSGGIGRRAGFKIQWPQGRVGSSPTSGTFLEIYGLFDSWVGCLRLTIYRVL